MDAFKLIDGQLSALDQVVWKATMQNVVDCFRLIL